MNYYKRHLGDYAKDTKHLSLAEHGAFSVLLDYFYATEKPIPDDRCERIANAYADFERAAVRTVLKEFFTETPEGWVNKRATVEIEASKAKSLKAKGSAERRWGETQCERNANASKKECDGNASHKPLAISHKEQKQKRASADAPVDPKAALWAGYKALPDSGGGAFLAKLIKSHDEQSVLEAVERTIDHAPADPKAFIVGLLRKAVKQDDAYDALMAKALRGVA